MTWIVLQIKPNQSKKAELNLNNQNFKTFFPRISYKSKNKTYSKDVFLGYAFVKVKDFRKLGTINSTYGVSKILSISGRVPSLGNNVILNIRDQVAQYNKFYKTRTTLVLNDQVIIKLDIFKDQPAEIINIVQRKGTRSILLKILGSKHTVWVNESLISSKLP